jgi:hypothetical protein
MDNLVFPNYLVDLYAITWCLYLLRLAIKGKMHLSIISWCLAQIILFIINFFNNFLNKGYCILSSCEPSNTIRHFLDLNFPPNIISLIRFISMSLMFLMIYRMTRLMKKLKRKDL